MFSSGIKEQGNGKEQRKKLEQGKFTQNTLHKKHHHFHKAFHMSSLGGYNTNRYFAIIDRKELREEWYFI